MAGIEKSCPDGRIPFSERSSPRFLLLPRRDAVRIADIVNGSQLSTGKALDHAPVQHLKLELKGLSTTLPDKPGVTMVTICRDPSPHHAFRNTEFPGKELIAPFASGAEARNIRRKIPWPIR